MVVFLNFSKLYFQDVVIQRGGPDLPSPDEDCSSPVLRSFQRGGSDTTSGGAWRSMYAALPADYNIVGRSGSRGKSLESLEDAPLGYPPSPAPSTHTQPVEWRPRSFEDGDLTPTNDTSVVDAGGGTLPRPRHCLVRPRPVAKVIYRKLHNWDKILDNEATKDRVIN